MRTKIVYVLVSRENDYYYEMFLMSLYSLRLYHPKGDAEVVLVMDTDTHQRLIDKKAPIFDDVTSVVVDIPEKYTIIQRSRYLKTSLRQRVKGDFLYLDCDTIIYSSLIDADAMDVEIAMVSDGNDELNYRNDLSIIYCERAGFTELEKTPYFNSGVIYSSDTPTATKFFVEWHKLWNISVIKGVPQDQPSLCQANKNLSYPIKELSAMWNNMNVTKEELVHTKIRHYFAGINSLARQTIINYVKVNGRVDDLDYLFRHPLTLCESALIISNERYVGYISTDLFYIYESSNKLFYRLSLICQYISKIYISISKIKRRLW